LTFEKPLRTNTNRIHDNIRGVKLTPASRRRYKIALPVEGLMSIRCTCVCTWGLSAEWLIVKSLCLVRQEAQLLMG